MNNEEINKLKKQKPELFALNDIANRFVIDLLAIGMDAVKNKNGNQSEMTRVIAEGFGHICCNLFHRFDGISKPGQLQQLLEHSLKTSIEISLDPNLMKKQRDVKLN